MQFSKGAGDNTLTAPITQEQLSNLTASSLTNPMVGNSHGVVLPERLSTIDGLRESASEVLAVRGDVEKGKSPHWFMEKWWPSQWGEYRDTENPILISLNLYQARPEGMANAVHMDEPDELPRAILRYLLRLGYKPKTANPLYNDFLSVVDVYADVASAVRTRLRQAFEIKSYYLTPRPEEIWNMDNRSYFTVNATAYEEGCPTHGSFVAGHATKEAAGASEVLRLLEPLDAEPLFHVRDAVYRWSQSRAFAGVHHAEDNLEGMRFGGLT